MIKTSLLQLRVLSFDFFQNGGVGVGVFPEGEEILVGGECPDAGGIGTRSLRGSRLQRVRTSHAKMRQGSRPESLSNATPLEPQLDFPTEAQLVLARGKNPYRLLPRRP